MKILVYIPSAEYLPTLMPEIPGITTFGSRSSRASDALAICVWKFVVVFDLFPWIFFIANGVLRRALWFTSSLNLQSSSGEVFWNISWFHPPKHRGDFWLLSFLRQNMGKQRVKISKREKTSTQLDLRWFKGELFPDQTADWTPPRR